MKMNPVEKLVFRGKKFLENDQYQEALSCFEQAILLDPNNPELWNFKAVSLRSIGRYEEAMESFNKSLEIDPRDKNAS